MSQTPKLTKPDRAAPAAKQKGPKPLCTSAEQHQCLCGQLQLEQGRESLVKYAQQESEKIAEDGEHTSDPSLKPWPYCNPNPRYPVSPNKLPKGPKPPKPTHVRVEAKTDKEQRVQSGYEPKGPVGGFASPKSSKVIKFGDAQNPRGALGRRRRADAEPRRAAERGSISALI